MKKTAVGLAVLALALLPATIRAQGLSIPPYELNIHAGGLFPSSQVLLDDSFITGVRFNMIPGGVGVGFGGNFDWVPTGSLEFISLEDERVKFDSSILMYSGEVNFSWATSGAAVFFGVGAGAVTTSVDKTTTEGIDPEDIDVPDSFTDFMMPISLGFKWYMGGMEPKWNIRFDLRDNIVWNEDLIFGTTSAKNNWEMSAGIGFLFGS